MFGVLPEDSFDFGSCSVVLVGIEVLHVQRASIHRVPIASSHVKHEDELGVEPVLQVRQNRLFRLELDAVDHDVLHWSAVWLLEDVGWNLGWRFLLLFRLVLLGA